MLLEENERRQKLLKDWIFEMSDKSCSEADMRVKALKLKDIYSQDFRHSYSSFFPIIVEIFKDENNHNQEYLSTNLELFRKYIESDYINANKEFQDIYDNVNKLCDHLNLEIARMLYYSQTNEKILGLEVNSKKLNNDLNSSRKELEAATKRAASIQTELIAVLSIFSAIVMTFSGSFSFLGSALTSIENTVIFKAILICIVCGMVLFNTVFLLLYLVSKLTERNIYAKCKSENCTCGQNGTPKCRGIVRIRKRLPYVFYFNVLCVIIIFIDTVSWVIFSLLDII